MALIGSIVLDEIVRPAALSRALRLLLEDHLDRDDFAFENPVPRHKESVDIIYRFFGDESSFVFVETCNGRALRVDVHDVSEDSNDPADAAERSLIDKFVRQLGAKGVIGAVCALHAADLDQKPGISAKQWRELHRTINALGFDEAMGRLLPADDDLDDSTPPDDNPPSTPGGTGLPLVPTVRGVASWVGRN